MLQQGSIYAYTLVVCVYMPCQEVAACGYVRMWDEYMCGEMRLFLDCMRGLWLCKDVG